MDVGKILSDSLISSLRAFINISRGIIIIPIITKLVGVSEFGVWILVNSIVGLAVSVSSLHLHGSLIHFSSISNIKENDQIYIDILILSTILSFTLSLTLNLLGRIAIDIYTTQYQGFSILPIVNSISMLIILTVIYRISLNNFRAQDNIKMYEITTVIKGFLEIIALTLIFYFTRNIYTALYGLVLVIGAIDVMLLYTHINTIDINVDLRDFKRYIGYSYPMLPHSLTNKLHSNIDRYLILYFLGPAAVGLYSVCYSIASIFRILTGVLNPTLYPKISEAFDNNNHGEIKELYDLIVEYYILIAIPALVGLIIVGDEVLILIGPTEINEVFYLLPILSFGFLIRGIDNPVAYILTASENTKYIGISTFLATLLNISLNLFLIPAIGIYGAALATILSQFAITAAILHVSRKIIPISIPSKPLANGVFASFIMGAITYVIDLFISGIVALIITPLVGVIIYSIVIIFISDYSVKQVCNISI